MRAMKLALAVASALAIAWGCGAGTIVYDLPPGGAGGSITISLATVGSSSSTSTGAMGCTQDSACPSGHCVTGVCCNMECSGSCQSCLIAGHVGTCTNAPAGVPGSPACPTGSCDGDGQCGATGARVGEKCSGNADCANQLCSFGYCRLPSGSPCGEDVECSSDRCVDQVCAACQTDGDCQSGLCDLSSKRCFLAPGQSCGGTGNCAVGQCSFDHCGLWKGNECQGDIDCVTRRCDNGLCAVCANDGDCASGACNVAGTLSWCLAPAGWDCAADNECASNICAPTPLFRKCL